MTQVSVAPEEGRIEKIAKPKLVQVDGKDMPKAPLKEHASLPKPVGWQILIAMPEVEERTEGGIIKADVTKDIESTSTVIGLILAMGDQCYSDEERFGQTPWCKEGDFVLIGAYKGVRFKIFDKEFRLINDDTVKAIVDDPRGYTRA